MKSLFFFTLCILTLFFTAYPCTEHGMAISHAFSMYHHFNIFVVFVAILVLIGTGRLHGDDYRWLVFNTYMHLCKNTNVSRNTLRAHFHSLYDCYMLLFICSQMYIYSYSICTITIHLFCKTLISLVNNSNFFSSSSTLCLCIITLESNSSRWTFTSCKISCVYTYVCKLCSQQLKHAWFYH